MNILLDAWATTMWRACWQGGLVVLVVWSICRLLPSMPARFQCWLWRLAILKFMVVLLVPWFLNVPLLPPTLVPEHLAFVPLAPTTQIHQEPLEPVSALPMPSPTTLPTLSHALFLVWIIGVCWSLAHLLAAWRNARRLREGSSPISDAVLYEQLANQAAASGVRRPDLRSVSGGGSPMLVGIVRPAILMPATTLGRLSISEQKMVLGHELAHIRRGDLLWSIVVAAVRAVFFFHPLVWLSHWRLGLAQEIAADELTISQDKHDPAGYGKLLVSVLGKFGQRSWVSTISAETAGTTHSLAKRLIAMTRIGRTPRRVVIASGILLGVGILVCLIPWRLVATRTTGCPEQEESVAKIRQLGGEVHLDEKNPGEPVTFVSLAGTKVNDAELEHLKGLSQLRYLLLDDTTVTDAGLETLKGLSQLRWLLLDGTKVTDAGLEHLKGLAQLQMLFLNGTKVSDAGVQRVTRLKQLNKLALNDTQVTSAGLEHLKRLSHLQDLRLAHTPVTDAGLEDLKGLSELQKLFLSGTKITDAGLMNLSGLAQLIQLVLDSTSVTDEGLVHVGKLSQLRLLDLNHTKITDAGLEHLKSLSHLERLELNDTLVTDEGVKRLQRALSKCYIQH